MNWEKLLTKVMLEMITPEQRAKLENSDKLLELRMKERGLSMPNFPGLF